MRLQVNPNRMELSRLKKRLATAKRGHKLLKDKQDELMRKFIELVRENYRLRKEVEEKLNTAYQDFTMASSLFAPEETEEALLISKEKISIDIRYQNIMSVMVPVMEFKRSLSEEESIYPYGFYNTSQEMDQAIYELFRIVNQLLKLGEIEKTCELMTDEIQKTRRRVNALEYMTIPQLEETIQYISMKLDENERANITRLLKLKSMMNS